MVKSSETQKKWAQYIYTYIAHFVLAISGFIMVCILIDYGCKFGSRISSMLKIRSLLKYSGVYNPQLDTWRVLIMQPSYMIDGSREKQILND